MESVTCLCSAPAAARPTAQIAPIVPGHSSVCFSTVVTSSPSAHVSTELVEPSFSAQSFEWVNSV